MRDDLSQFVCCLKIGAHKEPESDDDVEPGSEDEGVNEGSSGLREGDWSYSAEHFSDLKTYMFIDSSDEEF